MSDRRWWVLLLALAVLLPHWGQPQDSPFGRKPVSKPAKDEAPASSASSEDEPEKPTLDAAARGEIGRIAREYFKAKSDAKPALLAKVIELENGKEVSKADIEKFRRDFLALAKEGPRHTGGGGGRNKFAHPDYPGEYILGGSGTMLFIGLHGGGQGVGDAGQIAGLFGGMPGAVNVFPTVIQKDATAWNTEREEQYVLELIEAMKRSFPIDTNRIYLAGHSMGGYGTWSIGGRHADLFAAISPQAGGVFTMGGGGQQGGKLEIMRGIVENLKATPIYFYHGANDAQVPPGPDRRAAEKLEEYKKQFGPYDYVYKEYPNIGHGLPPDGVGPIWNWMKGKTRNPYPKFVIWEPTRSYKRNFFWLRLENPGQGQRVEAKIESGNRISLSGNFSNLEIYLNEKMGISLGREVVVERDGKEVFKGRVGHSVAALLDSIDAKKDEQMYFTARIRVP
jgi:predicted esterase